MHGTVDIRNINIMGNPLQEVTQNSLCVEISLYFPLFWCLTAQTHFA